jgi:Helicase conserved C-terminal domain/SNF2-related domain
MVPFQQRVLAEDLIRIRRPDDRERYAAAQRQARIDPNPHQIDAVIFALRRLREGGCILADEVGLGKTIEAGLVIAQIRAEGAQRILLIVPKSLLGQWQTELLELFGIQCQESASSFGAPGVYLVGREFAGGQRGSDLLSAAPPFDLAVIDEAHEIFAGLYRRYGPDGLYDETSEEAMTAHRVRVLLRTTPVLLLTATPIQNSLAELWGLVQYVEPTGTLLGDLATFRKVFCEEGDRVLVRGQEHELQRRLAMVLQRTLRRQAQEFLDRPFTQRRCRLYEYGMSTAERSLYEDVTEYLLEPTLNAFAGKQRKLMLIQFHRRMASSIKALAASLDNVATRLRRMQMGQELDDTAFTLSRDLEEEEVVEQDPPETPQDAEPATVAEELLRVQSFVARAQSLPDDTKARRFQEAVKVILDLGEKGRGTGKAVVFTESITTQNYLRQLLLDFGLQDEEITLFRGVNDSERAKQAYARWKAEELARLPTATMPSREVAVRLALVHEFRTRSRIFISTEAGAKGLNLQFCETVINYDLPWNPQRIEQRIGRCHRYGQKRDVTVINFTSHDNEAQQLTFEILSQKLDLFGKVLDASDTVLHEPRTDSPEIFVAALATDFETDLRNIYSRSRTVEEMTREIAALRDKITERRDTYEREYLRTSQIIESRFDDKVRKVFRCLRDELPDGLADLDRDLARLIDGFLTTQDIPFRRSDEAGQVLFQLEDNAVLPEEFGQSRRFSTGDARRMKDAEALNLLHPLVQHAIAEARAWPGGGAIRLLLPLNASPELLALAGKQGLLCAVLVHYEGFEPAQSLLGAALVSGMPIDPALATQVLHLPAMQTDKFDIHHDAHSLDDAVDEAVFIDQRHIEEGENKHFERAIGQLERYVEDKILVCRRELASLDLRLRSAKARRDQIVGASARQRVEEEITELATRAETLEHRIETLESREDEVYQKWREKYYALRYQAPTVTRLFQSAFEIAPATPETSC